MLLHFEISEKSFETLKAINEAGSAEFRDTEHESLEAFKKSDEYSGDEDVDGIRSERWFKVRNFCDHKDCDELLNYGLIDSDGESWHITYILTPFGKQVLEMNKR